MGENLIISILGDIRSEVWDRDIPSSTCPEYIEHHNDCVVSDTIALVNVGRDYEFYIRKDGYVQR